MEMITFLEKAKELYGDKFDYSQVTRHHFDNDVKNHVPIRCNTCQCHWSSC